MKRGEITISKRGIFITAENGEIWMSAWEIAHLFDVFMAKVTSNIKAVFKSGVLCEREVCYCYRYTNGGCVDLYNLDMIIALAFRIKSRNSEIFRSWLMKRACSKSFFLIEQLFDKRKMCLN